MTEERVKDLSVKLMLAERFGDKLDPAASANRWDRGWIGMT